MKDEEPMTDEELVTDELLHALAVIGRMPKIQQAVEDIATFLKELDEGEENARVLDDCLGLMSASPTTILGIVGWATATAATTFLANDETADLSSARVKAFSEIFLFAIEETAASTQTFITALYLGAVIGRLGRAPWKTVAEEGVL